MLRQGQHQAGQRQHRLGDRQRRRRRALPQHLHRAVQHHGEVLRLRERLSPGHQLRGHPAGLHALAQPGAHRRRHHQGRHQRRLRHRGEHPLEQLRQPDLDPAFRWPPAIRSIGSSASTWPLNDADTSPIHRRPQAHLEQRDRQRRRDQRDQDRHVLRRSGRRYLRYADLHPDHLGDQWLGDQEPEPSASYNANRVVTLTAVPNAGYVFTGWSGDATGTANPLSVTMTRQQEHHGELPGRRHSHHHHRVSVQRFGDHRPDPPVHRHRLRPERRPALAPADLHLDGERRRHHQRQRPLHRRHDRGRPLHGDRHERRHQRHGQRDRDRGADHRLPDQRRQQQRGLALHRRSVRQRRHPAHGHQHHHASAASPIRRPWPCTRASATATAPTPCPT